MERRHFSRDAKKFLEKAKVEGPVGELALAEALRHCQIPAARRIAGEILAAHDPSHSGFITREDFTAYMHALDRSLERLFDRFDTARRGAIRVDDFRQLAAEFASGMSTEQVDLFLKAMDKEENELITYREFVHYYHLLPVTRLASLFDLFDLEAVDPAEPACRRVHVAASGPSTLLAGALAGAVSRTVTAPIDRLRTLMQVDRGRLTIWATLSRMWQAEGIRGLFKGNGVSVLKIMPETATKMYAYELVKPKLSAEPGFPTAFERFLAGGVAGVVSQTLIYPLDLAKVQLMVSRPGEFTGFADCLARAYRRKGFFGLYRGWVPTVVGAIPYSAVDLGTFNTLKEYYLHRVGLPLSAMGVVVCGAFAGLCGQTVAYPFFVVRTRLQSFSNPGAEYGGFGDCVRQTYAHEGVRGFFKGILPSYIRGIPTVAITYLVFERAKAFIGNHVW